LKREPYDKANNNESRQSDRTPPMPVISNNRIGNIQAILRERSIGVPAAGTKANQG